MFRRLMALLAACFALAVLCAGCTTPGTSGAPRSVADGWLRAQALIPGERGPQ
jgi:hypothetical protein